MKISKKFIVILIIIFVIISILIYNKFYSTGKSVSNSQVEIIPLSKIEQQKVAQTILSSEFIKDVPNDNPIVLRFFSFENGQRIWRDGFLIGKNQLLASGKPTVQLVLHSKYISELNSNNICEVIKKANKNGDLGFYSEHNKATLLWKYKSMLKYRECFGF